MPLYDFKNLKTGEIETKMMSIADMEEYVKNPNIQKVPVAINMVRSVMGQRSMQTDSGWKDNLSRIAEAHPSSNLATNHGDKSSKAVKTRQAIDKWKRKRAADTSR